MPGRSPGIVVFDVRSSGRYDLAKQAANNTAWEDIIVRIHHGISRRHMLTMAGGLALAGSMREAFAEPARRIERLDPALDALIDTSQTIQELATGFGGNRGPAEGPVWWKEGGYLLFSDIHNNRRMKYTPGKGVTVDLEPSNGANGLTRDSKGRLVSCERQPARVARRELDGSTTVVANSFQGQRLHGPNDVIVKSDGSYYFTDPGATRLAEQWELQYSGVFRVSADLGTMTLLTDGFVSPNGLAFTPDERVLYINDSRRRHIRAFEMQPNGMIARHSDRVVAELGGSESGNPDGMKVDVSGNVYCGGGGGLYILDSSGKKLGRIVHGYSSTTNIAFGGDDWKTLYFTTRTALMSVNLKVAGVPVPATAPRI